ncbi:putative holin [Alkanindiges illinoisensis]|jgi:hypothetical protein|uniref:Phage holin n=1 Tax=Alkanindiges illinoisensis TaxID=197183 RepID=A0A4Y7X9T3_9GAMM|nr:putative holin [Alkanindiges illinoisensis]TEU24692.1 hypothetical protein E2B99_11345 [Alkanindiges illinoisensis]
MAEPATTTATTALAISVASLLPFVNGNALLGAVLGAALFATTKKDLRAFARLGTMLLSTGFGYLLAPEVTARTFITSDATAGLLAAIFALPILIKMMVWVDQSPLADIFSKFPGGRK